MGAPGPKLTPATTADLVREYEQSLRKGRAFVAGVAGFGEREPTTLTVVHPETGLALALPAEVVHVSDAGVGLSLAGLQDADRERLRVFVEGGSVAVADVSIAPPEELIPVEDELIPVEDELVPVDEPTDDDAPRGAEALHLHDRIRRLSLSEQQRVARSGTLTERVALERAFGPAVWEALLSNARLTVPEVARIARKGTVPKPLIDQIGANGSWVGAGEVQRALLSNPRTSAGTIQRVLRSMPRLELQRVPQQTAYTAAARDAAKRMIKALAHDRRASRATWTSIATPAMLKTTYPSRV